MRVLGLAAYPELAASTRFRMTQYRELLRERGIELQVVTSLDSAAHRALYTSPSAAWKALHLGRSALRHTVSLAARRAPDLLWVQREAALIGPEIAETWASRFHRVPLVLDVDDAIWLEPPEAGALNPRWTRLLRAPGKVDRLARRATAVMAGSSHLAAHFLGFNPWTTVIPTVPSRVRFLPKHEPRERLRIGWIGSHSTAPFVAALAPVFQRLREGGYVFDVQLIGGESEGMPSKPFRLEDEVSDLQSFDIGVAPMPEGPWIDGKCGLKQLEYMAVGIPCVTSPWRGAHDFVIDGDNALVARSADDWYRALSALLSDAALRARLGSAGRRLVEGRMCAEAQAVEIARIFHHAVS